MNKINEKICTSAKKLIGVYDTTTNNTPFRIIAFKSAFQYGTLKKFPTQEHESAHRIRPENAVRNSTIGTMTKNIITDYYNLSM